jgi:DNA-directed RNA polymerase specialized sigma24 family protein
VCAHPDDPLTRFMRSAQDDEGPAYVRGIVVHRVYGDNHDPRDVDQQYVDELASDVAARAFEARSSPPDFDGIRRWLPRLVKSALADRTRREERERARIDRAADAYDWADRNAPGTDWGAREHLLCKLLDLWLDNPVKRETFRMMFQTNLEGHTLAEVARMCLKTRKAIEMRTRKLRNELAPKVAVMDRQNRGTVVLRVRPSKLEWSWSSEAGGARRRDAPAPRRGPKRGRR